MYNNRYSSLCIDNDCIDNDCIENDCIRKNAYAILSDKQQLKDKLFKTSMCNNKNCTNKNCSFAHSKDELRIRECIFGAKCLFIHSKNKPCMYKHPNECIDTYLERIKTPCITHIKL